MQGVNSGVLLEIPFRWVDFASLSLGDNVVGLRCARLSDSLLSRLLFLSPFEAETGAADRARTVEAAASQPVSTFCTVMARTAVVWHGHGLLEGLDGGRIAMASLHCIARPSAGLEAKDQFTKGNRRRLCRARME